MYDSFSMKGYSLLTKLALVRYKIKNRRESLRQRREMLALARDQQKNVLEPEFETKDVLLQDR